MKSTLKYFRKITFLLFFVSLAAYSQAPQGFNYQATVRNNLGQLIINQTVNIRTNILQNAQTNAPVYTETHTVSTDSFGQINLAIGAGTTSLGTFSSINWANGSYYLSIELNNNGNFVTMGVAQLLSVPYALYARNTGGGYTLPTGTTAGDVLAWNGTTWVATAAANQGGLPAIATISATAITGIEAKCGGAIASNGTSNIVAKGVCWSTNPNPTTSNSFTVEGPGNIDFISTLTNLTPGTLYFYRAYATNNEGTAYGATYTFTTIALPSISSNAVTTVTNSGAQSGGFVGSQGGSALIAKGIVWGTNPNPTVNLTTLTNEGSALGSFNSTITGLIYNTTYYVRAYATNAAGTAYGSQQQFTTVNFLSPNLDFTFNYNQPLLFPGTNGLTLYNVNAGGNSYDMDYYVFDAQFNDTGLTEATSAAEPEHLTISDLQTNPDGLPNASYLPDGTYYVFYSLFQDATLSTIADFTPIDVPTAVDYVRQGGALSGTFVQEEAFVPTTKAPVGDTNFVISFTKFNGVYTLNNSVPEVIASGRFSNNIKNTIDQARKNRRKL